MTDFTANDLPSSCSVSFSGVDTVLCDFFGLATIWGMAYLVYCIF